ncbi:MAG TPA: LysR substrate-binding domain-containing protein [Acidimicrobiales bacterium]|nr:LysR substrate-binding domain-containing protein [Acidimicrobiales bacterium]
MQLPQLAYAVAVAEERHFTRAAARLHVAQPSLSRQIRLLERELGVELFHRGPGQNRVELTAEGEILLPLLRRVLADVEATASEARSLAGLASGRLSVGATPSLATRYLPAALARFHARHPGVELFLVESGSRHLVPRVAEGELDLALVVLPVTHPLVLTTEMFEDRLVLVVAPDHPLAGRRQIRVANLAGLELVMFREGYDLRASTLAACRAAGFEPRVVTEGGEMDGVLAMVAAGLGAAVIPEIAVPTDGSLRALRFVHPGLSRTVAVARRRDRPPSHTARAFSSLLAEMPTGP